MLQKPSTHTDRIGKLPHNQRLASVGKAAHTYDIAIIGSGIAGSSLACILAKAGMDVVVFDAGAHPRFAIGESMILETSEIMRSLAHKFDVPELEYYSSENFMPFIGTQHGVKRHFGFMCQAPGQAHKNEETIQAIIPKAPYGHELHIFRQDSDAQICAAAIRYGARVLQNTPVAGVKREANGVTIDAGGDTYRADFVVDAGGARSVLASEAGTRHTNLRTQSRAIFTHMTGVKPVTGGKAGLPFTMAEGTLHHVFEGGWAWVIPFDNHPDAASSLCSVGLMLDPDVHPPRENLSPEEEFREFVSNYPDLAAQFEDAQPVRNWTRTGRLQYSTHHLAGERTFLLGHAAGFIDPLFSKGLYTSLAAVMGLADALIAAHQDKDYRAERFAKAEQTTLEYIQANDRLVANAYKTFAVPRLWRRYAALWILGAYLELVRLTTYRLDLMAARDRGDILPDLPDLALVGGGYDKFKTLADTVDTMIEAVDMHDPAAVETVITNIDTLYAKADWMPESHRNIALGARHLPTRKYTPKLFLRKGGLLGATDYRRHFFRGISEVRLAKFMALDGLAYSRAAIKRRHRRALRDRI